MAVKSNCSLQSYLPALAVINEKYPIDHALVTTYQAISGAGKTFKTWPEMVDNLIPYIGGEEMKSEVEPNKILGKIENGEIVPSNELQIECQTYRVPVSNGHTASIFFTFKDGVKNFITYALILCRPKRTPRHNVKARFRCDCVYSVGNGKS